MSKKLRRQKSYGANHLGVRIIEIQLDGLKQDIAVMHISHVHLGHHRGKGYLAKIVEKSDRQIIKGFYEERNTKVFVSQGAGIYGPRMRLGSSNEINLIRLKAKQ